MDEDVAKAHGLKPMARITRPRDRRRAPKWVMMAPGGGPEALRADQARRLERLRSDRAQRGLRGPGGRAHPQARARPREGQRQRRRGRARSPDRLLGRARPDDAALRAAGSRPREAAGGLCLGGGNAVALVRRDDLMSNRNGAKTIAMKSSVDRRRDHGQRHRPVFASKARRRASCSTWTRLPRPRPGGDREEPRPLRQEGEDHQADKDAILGRIHGTTSIDAASEARARRRGGDRERRRQEGHLRTSSTSVAPRTRSSRATPRRSRSRSSPRRRSAPTRSSACTS
jgi:hypothetical protein